MKKIILKLINNERKNGKIMSMKACHPYTADLTYCYGATDICVNSNGSACFTGAYDYCKYSDNATCRNNIQDICDYDYRSGCTSRDYCSTDTN